METYVRVSLRSVFNILSILLLYQKCDLFCLLQGYIFFRFQFSFQIYGTYFNKKPGKESVIFFFSVGHLLCYRALLCSIVFSGTWYVKYLIFFNIYLFLCLFSLHLVKCTFFVIKFCRISMFCFHRFFVLFCFLCLRNMSTWLIFSLFFQSLEVIAFTVKQC